MKKVLGRKGYTVELMKFKTGRKDKSGAPIFEEIMVKNFCSKNSPRRLNVYHVSN